MNTIPMNTIAYPQGIYAIDTGYHTAMHDALYAVVDHGRVALIDCGTNYSLPRIEHFLASIGLDKDAVDYQILTHIHLDHAGGAGAVMQKFPHARLVVHPRGAPHMADPSKLIAATEAVYGQAETQKLYGRILPIDPTRILVTNDGLEISLGERQLLCIDTPGHAKHHIAIRDSLSGGFFTGDTFGLSYREFDQINETGVKQFVFPTTTPSQFDPEALRATHARIASYAPPLLYLTHFGAITFTPELPEQQGLLIDTLAHLALRIHNTAESAEGAQTELCQEMAALLLETAQGDGWANPDRILTRFAMDIQLNAQGLLDWAKKHSTVR